MVWEGKWPTACVVDGICVLVERQMYRCVGVVFCMLAGGCMFSNMYVCLIIALWNE